MPKVTESWVELKEFEHCQSSPLAFRAIAALLDSWPDNDRAKAIAYVEKLLIGWPDGDRLAPWSWCKAASRGNVPPSWPLVRALQLRGHHLSKGGVDLARLAHFADLTRITVLELPRYSSFQEISFLFHRPETFPALKQLKAVDKFQDGDIRALADSPLWQELESFEVNSLNDSLVHQDASRIVPKLGKSNPLRHLTLRATDLISIWDQNKLPRLTSVSVFIRSIDEAKELANRKELSKLASLSLAFRCGFSGSSPFEPFLGNVIEADEAAAEAFFSNARLDRLKSLSIFGYSMGYWGREGMGRLGLESLVASGLLQKLKSLHFELLPLGDKGIALLAPTLGPQLETLELRNVYCKDRGAAALIKSPCLPSLRRLDLSGNRIDAKGSAKLAGIDMPRLEHLDLSGPDINPYYWNIGQQPLLDSGVLPWINSAKAQTLKSLRIQNCHLTDETMVAILQSPYFQKLEHLEVSHNAFTVKAMSHASGSTIWKTLAELGLRHCRLDNPAIEALTKVNAAPNLRVLELAYNSIGPKGAAALARWPVLSKVWSLDLHDNVIGDEGLIALAKSAHLGRLLELDLEQDCWNSRSFDFSSDAAKALARSQSLPRLDGLFTGCVDEYHGAAYSAGFKKADLDAVRKAKWMRPACKAACSDFSNIGDYIEGGAFDEARELGDHDFRAHPMTLNEREASGKEHRMRQVRAPGSRKKQDVEKITAPKISELKDLEFDQADIIEGIEFREPS